MELREGSRLAREPARSQTAYVPAAAGPTPRRRSTRAAYATFSFSRLFLSFPLKEFTAFHSAGQGDYTQWERIVPYWTDTWTTLLQRETHIGGRAAARKKRDTGDEERLVLERRRLGNTRTREHAVPGPPEMTRRARYPRSSSHRECMILS